MNKHLRWCDFMPILFKIKIYMMGRIQPIVDVVYYEAGHLVMPYTSW